MLVSIDQLSIPDWWQDVSFAPAVTDGLVRQLAKCSNTPQYCCIWRDPILSVTTLQSLTPGMSIAKSLSVSVASYCSMYHRSMWAL